MLKALIPLWAASAVASAALLSRDDHAGTGFLWGLALGPVGMFVVLRRRPSWERRWTRERNHAEEARKEQAWREWRGY
jgi:hypothetical protein